MYTMISNSKHFR
uniref:Uncharacterized protein n=1 Tax=Rhizophora mucronata TaxID=61149 RepID=A0A2P2QBH2_RHIMU